MTTVPVDPTTMDTSFSRARATEQAVHAVQNGRAARVVAHNSRDLADCVDLLEMLGLDAAEARATS